MQVNIKKTVLGSVHKRVKKTYRAHIQRPTVLSSLVKKNFFMYRFLYYLFATVDVSRDDLILYQKYNNICL